jgi:hypothetical protein
MEEHCCLEFLEFHQAYQVETHGLECGPYERWWEEWWTCEVCGETYSQRDVDAMSDEQQPSS